MEHHPMRRIAIAATCLMIALALGGCVGYGAGGGSRLQPGDLDRSCMSCGGSGYVHYVTTNETAVCHLCSGTGWIRR